MRAALLAAVLSATGARAVRAQEVVVVQVEPGLAGAKVGLRPGDRLTGWVQPPDARGTFSSPFAFLRAEIERGPRGPVEVSGLAGERAITAALFPDEWGVEVRPMLEAEPLAEYESARRSRDGGDTQAALRSLRRLAALVRNASPDTAAWAVLQLAEAQGAADPRAAGDSAREAVRLAAEPGAQAMIQAHFAAVLWKQGHLAEAAAVYDEAISREEAVDRDGLGLARLVESAGRLAFARLADLPRARERLVDARRIVEREAPRSLACARTLLALAQTQDSNAEARTMLQQAAPLAEALAPGSLTLASILYMQAWVTAGPEQLQLARRALAIREERVPGDGEVVDALSLLALVLENQGMIEESRSTFERALRLLDDSRATGSRAASVAGAFGSFLAARGELGEAERYLRRALALKAAASPRSVSTAISMLNLGDLLATRREFEEAELQLQQAVAILEHEAPGSDALAYGLRSLADLSLQRGRAAAAEAGFRRALAIFEKVSPGSTGHASIEDHLGRALLAQGRTGEAYAAQQHALQLVEAAPHLANLHAAEIPDDLAAIELRRGDLDAAQRSYEKALALRKRLAPGSVWEAISQHELGVLARRRGRRTEALAYLRAAVEALEEQGRRLGGSATAGAAFRAHYRELYRDLEELLLEEGREREAFTVAERGRARALLALLAQRDLRFPEVSPELETSRRQADADHDALVRRLAALGAQDAGRKDLLAQLEAVLLRQEEARARIRAAAPRVALLREPQPLDLEGVRRTLDPGTLLLAYSVGPAKSRVYAVGPGPDEFAVHDLGAGEAEIRAQVTQLRKLVEERRGPMLRRALDQQGRRLSTVLLGPVRLPVGAARRILVVPDGVLHLVPFAALHDPADATGRRYLIERTPLHVSSSVTLLAQLDHARTASHEAVDVVGFGDPLYDRSPGSRPDAAATRAAKLGLRLAALPATRGELEALRKLAPESARIWLGREATEARAKAVGPQARVLHFAAHGFVDEDFPLESGLALATPAAGDEAENGLLQAWEILESMRLEADLVTLSACRTALGKEVAGEGLLGLTWAFQYAGARSVLASLWEVSDQSTAELMRHFYAARRAGSSKAEALRAAQLALLRRPQTAAPFYWAAFELVGDWQ